MPETAKFARRKDGPPLVLGHRGVRGSAPENTLAAFARAAAAGADGVELDVRLCATGELVVAHDPTLARPTRGADERPVADVPWAELGKIDVGGGEHVPLLADVLPFCAARGLVVNVEMKRDVPSRLGVVRATARALAAVPGAPSWAIVSSFDPWMLLAFSALLPKVDTGFLFQEDQRWLRSGWAARPLSAAAVHPERTLVTAHRLSAWKKSGFRVHVWTVNDVDEARALGALGADAIITDVPERIVGAVR